MAKPCKCVKFYNQSDRRRDERCIRWLKGTVCPHGKVQFFDFHSVPPCLFGVYRCLKRSRIDMVEQLQVMTDDELKKIRGFGLKCLKEVRQIVPRKPIIPGPMENDPNMAELCFRNGEENMKEKVIALLMEHTQIGPEPEYACCHRHIEGIIQKIEKL